MKGQTCKKCGCAIAPLEAFPGPLCFPCYEKKFDADVKKAGGVLPLPDFIGTIAKK